MQTFLPSSSFQASAECLDRQRLGKQRVECLQILRALHEPGYGWRHHPAVRMWRGYDRALTCYAHAVCTEWTRRGYEDNTLGRILEYASIKGAFTSDLTMPHWLGSAQFHASHRAALLHKNPEHYGQFGWSEQPQLDYVWPA